MGQENYIDEMLLALNANINYLKQEGFSQLKIRNGILLNDIGESYNYRFTLNFFQDIDPETDVEVRVGRNSGLGRVIAVNDKEIDVQLDRNLGSSIPEAILVISNYYLLQLLCDKLTSVKNKEITFTDLAEKTFGLKTFQTGVDDHYTVPPSKGFPPNVYQENAIRLALGSEVSFIWGPPGTGKTTTIARIIEGFIGRDLSVLLLSHTNVATDGALLDFVKHLGINNENYMSGSVIRVGPIQKTALQKYEMVIPKIIAEKRIGPIKDEISRLTNDLGKIDKGLSNIEKLILILDLIEDLRGKINNLESYVHERREKTTLLSSNLERAVVGLSENEDKISKYYSSNTVSRFFAGLNIESLLSNKTKLLSSCNDLDQMIKGIAKEMDEANTSINKTNQELAEKEKLVAGKDRHELSIEKDSYKSQTSVFKDQISVLQEQVNNIENVIIREAKVVATTLTRSYSNKTILEREYDCVIVDEVSMAPLPALWCAAGLAKKRVVIVGDFYQLPPIVKHKVLKKVGKSKEEEEREEQLVNKWLRTDIFELNQIDKLIERGEAPDSLRQLKIQYRMHPDIASVVNELSYSKGGGQFSLESAPITHSNGEELLDQEPLKGYNLGLYSTDELGTIASRTDSGSYFNIYNALIAVRLSEIAIKNGYETVGIVSPFRAQTNLIQKMIIDRNLGKYVTADTVHRFQGDEKQVIVFDITTSQPTMLTDNEKPGGDDEKILNVAFSRAEEKCMVVVDVGEVKNKHSSSSFVLKYIDYCIAHEYPVIPSENLIPIYEVTESTETWLKKINDVKDLEKEATSSLIYDENDFYKVFYQDLISAESEVIIDSPYITSARVTNILPILHNLIKKGVKIFILTRVPKEHDENMKRQAEEQIRVMEEIGIKVLLFVGHIHRKLAIIDRNILWEGSLNILSHRDSHEIMRRFVGSETAKQVVTFLKLDKNIGDMGQDKIERCEFCSQPGAWYWTDRSNFGGLWTFCLANMHKKGTPPKTSEEIKEKKTKLRNARSSEKEYTPDGAPICPEHGVPMILRRSRYGELWGCPKYPRCKIIEKYGKPR